MPCCEALLNIIIIFLVIRLSATEAVKNLSGTVGGNITLPDPVLEKGFLLYERTNIAGVNKKELDILEETYTDRVHWNRNTGLFTLTDLQRKDSGIYVIDSKTGNTTSKSYKLTVYDPVPTPHVTTLSNSSDSCSFLCSVDKETTLLWYKDEEILNQSSSALSLSLSVYKQDFSSSYKCVAANPAETKTQPVNVKTSCGQDDTDSSRDENLRHYMVGIGVVISILGFLGVLFAVPMIKRKFFDQNKRPNGQDGEVLYSDIHIHDSRQGGPSPSPSTTIDRSNLTTVYDKLEVHRMIPDPAENTRS